jgi:hypothetical protein
MSDEPKKPGKSYKAGNIGPDGDYLTGKYRPPEAGKFRVGDGRKRGRRPKGTKNLETDFNEVLSMPTHVTIKGVRKKISNQRGLVLRLVDKGAQGNVRAIEYTLNKKEQFDERARERAESVASQDDDAIVEAFLARRMQHQNDTADGDPILDTEVSAQDETREEDDDDRCA